MSSQVSSDVSQIPSPDSLIIVGGDETSNEQSLPPYPWSQVQFPYKQFIGYLLEFADHIYSREISEGIVKFVIQLLELMVCKL